MKEPPFLFPVHRIISRIKIEDNLTRWAFVSFQKKGDEKISNRHRIVTDLVVTRRLQLAQLQPIERRLASYWGTILAARCQLARQNGHDRIVPQLIVVVEILIPQRNPNYPLPDKRCDRVFDKLRAPLVVKAGRKSIYQPNRTIRSSEQQRSGVRGNGATIKRRNNFASLYVCKTE